MKLYSIILLGAALSFALFFSSCKPDEPEPPNEEEVITTLRYTLTPAGGGTPVIFSFVDLDGDGGNAPVISTSPLAAQTTYAGKVEVLNESESPAEDITAEVEEEALEHQFFFIVDQGLDLTVAYDDMDTDQNPIGLSTTITTGAVGQGTLKVVLRHEPDKNATGVANGDIDQAGGETDIEVNFDVTIE